MRARAEGSESMWRKSASYCMGELCYVAEGHAV